jgi:hypothetical protein
MTEVHGVLTWLHALGGAVALVVMWVPLFSRKGGTVHRRAGKVFVASMAWVSVSALLASALKLALRPEQPQQPLMLSLVAIQAASAAWWGVSVLRQKPRNGAGRVLPDWIAAMALLGSGALAVVYWIQGASFLFAIFGALNLVFGWRFSLVLGRAPKSSFWWWYEHLFGMIVACIGALTAFFVVNYNSAPEAFRSVVPPLVVWTAPGAVGGIAIAVAMRFYRRKFGDA